MVIALNRDSASRVPMQRPTPGSNIGRMSIIYKRVEFLTF